MSGAPSASGFILTTRRKDGRSSGRVQATPRDLPFARTALEVPTRVEGVVEGGCGLLGQAASAFHLPGGARYRLGQRRLCICYRRNHARRCRRGLLRLVCGTATRKAIDAILSHRAGSVIQRHGRVSAAPRPGATSSGANCAPPEVKKPAQKSGEDALQCRLWGWRCSGEPGTHRQLATAEGLPGVLRRVGSSRG